jgi:hypothetical protein
MRDELRINKGIANKLIFSFFNENGEKNKSDCTKSKL